MSFILSSSQGVVLATAMVISGTVIFLSLFRDTQIGRNSNQDSDSGKASLRSCLCSGDKKGKEKKKKKVRFTDDVKDSSGNSEEFRKAVKAQRRSKQNLAVCGVEIGVKGLQGNRVALHA